MKQEKEPSARLVDVAQEVASRCASFIVEGAAIEEALTGMKGFIGLEPLESRKGRCFRLRLDGLPQLFVKVLPEGAKAANEAAAAVRLGEAGISCPKAIVVMGPVLVRKFIEGKTASEELDMAISWGDLGYAGSLCSKMGLMLAMAHNIETKDGYGLVMNDLNLRNFIVSGGNELNIIDLADAGVGDQAKDMGGLAVHILTHRPGFTVASEAMADAAYRAYFAGMKNVPGVRSKAPEGLLEALQEAEGRRATSGLAELASEYMAHLRTILQESGEGIGYGA